MTEADAIEAPPGPNGYPLLGNSLDIARRPFEFSAELGKYGDVVSYRAAGRRLISIRRPDLIEQVLVGEFGRFERFLHTETGFDFATEGILFVQGEQWKRQRQIMQPAFTMDRIRSYADTMAEETATLVDSWSDGQEVALNESFSALTLRILTRTLFDLDVSGYDDVLSRGMDEVNRRASPSRSLTVLLPDWIPTPASRRYDQAMADCREKMDELIDERRAAEGEREDLLSILLTAADEGETDLSEAEIRDNLLTFLFAGHETTSLALTYTLMCLADHPDVAAKLRREVDAVSDGQRVTVEDVSRLEYVEAVIKESMRLYPPAYILFRSVLEDTRMDGYLVPEGAVLSIPITAIHTDPRYWDRPETFDPDRWMDGGGGGGGEANGEGGGDRPEYAYLPFGGGPRHCIGMRFAMLEMKLIVPTILQAFDLELSSDSEPEFDPGVTLQPATDVLIRLHCRNGD